MTLDPIIFDEFRKYAERKGIKISTWVTQKMREFVEEEKNNEKMKRA